MGSYFVCGFKLVYMVGNEEGGACRLSLVTEDRSCQCHGEEDIWQRFKQHLILCTGWVRRGGKCMHMGSWFSLDISIRVQEGR